MSAGENKNSLVQCETQDLPKPGKSTIDDQPKEELVKQVKKTLLLLQKSKNKCDALTKQCQDLQIKNNILKKNSMKEDSIEEEISRELKSKIQELWNQFVSSKSGKNQESPLCSLLDDIQKETSSKLLDKESLICNLQEELNKVSKEQNLTSKSLREADEQIHCMELKVDTLTMTCQYLQEDLKSSQKLNKELKDEVNILTAARDTALQSLSCLKDKFSTQSSCEVQNLSMEMEKYRQHEEVLVAELDECKSNILSQQEENDSLKLRIEEYEHEKIRMSSVMENFCSLNKELADLKNKFQEIDVKSNKLKEELQNKSFAFDEFNYEVEMLISSVKQGAKQKNISGSFKPERKPMQNIAILSALYDEIRSQLKNHINRTNCLEIDMEGMTQEKQVICDELNQVKDLNQFLEDEVKALMEENDQLKSELKSCEANMENDALHISKLESDLQEALGRGRIRPGKSESEDVEGGGFQSSCRIKSDTLKVFDPMVSHSALDNHSLDVNTTTVQTCAVFCDVSTQVRLEQYSVDASIQTECFQNEASVCHEAVKYVSPENALCDPGSQIDKSDPKEVVQSVQQKLCTAEASLQDLSGKFLNLQLENMNLLSANQSMKEEFESALKTQGINKVEFADMTRSLKEKLSATEARVNDLSNKFVALQEENILLLSENQSIKKKLESSLKTHDKIGKVKNVEVVQSLQEKLCEAETCLQDFSDKIVMIQDENKQLLVENQSMREKLKSSQKIHEIDKADFAETRSSLEEKLSASEIKVVDLSNKFIVIQEENKLLLSENQSMKEEYKSDEMGQVRSVEAVQSLQEKLCGAETHLQNISDKFVALQEEKKLLLSEYQTLKEDFESVLKAHEVGKAESAEMIRSLEGKLSAAETSLSDLSNKVEALHEENRCLLSENQNMKEDKESAVKTRDEISDVQSVEIFSLQEKLCGAETSLKDLSDKSVVLQEENNRLLSKNQSISEELERACKTRDDLEKTLDNKSLLLEGIHVQMDSLLSQMEELNEEIKVKESDLEAAHKTNLHLKSTLKQLSNLSLKKQSLLSSAYDLVSVLKEQKSQMLGEINVFKKDWSDVFQDASNTVCNVTREYNKCYSCVSEQKKIISEREAEILSLKKCFTEVEHEVSVILEVFKTNVYERREKLGFLGESFISWANNPEACSVSLENCLLQASQICSKSSETHHIDILKQRSGFMVQDIKKEMENMLYIINELILENEKKSEELGDLKLSCVPSLKKTISDLELKWGDHRCPLNHEEVKQQSSIGAKEDNDQDSILMQKQLAEMGIKMNKLKAVAVKAKRELAESKKMNECFLREKDDYKQQVNKIAQELDKISSANHQYAHNFQSLQTEYDKLQDNCEELKSKLESLEKDLSASVRELNESKEKCFGLQKALDESKNSLSISIVEKEAVLKKIVDLEGKLIILESTSNEKQKKVENLQADLSKSQKEVKDITEEHKAIKQQLNTALKDRKKHSLLDLEMADYERIVSELKSQLQKKCADIEELQADMENIVSKNNSLQEEMNHIENQRETEEKRAANLKEILEKTKSELTAVRSQETELKISVENLESQVEILVLQGEDYKLQLSQASAEIETLKESLKSSTENHQRIVRSLDSKVNALQQECSMTRKEVENSNQEFENYKIRVHSVLKQQKHTTATPFTPTEDESKENLEKLNEKLKLQAVDMGEKLRVMALESEALQEEHEHLLHRHSKLVEDLENMNRNWNERLDKVIMEKNQLQATQEILTTQHTMQTSLLTASFTKQIKDLQENHRLEIDSLQKQIESSDVEISRLKMELTKSPTVLTTSSVPDDAIPFDICSQERQEGEGSECTDEQSTPIRHLSLATIPTTGFLPLEKLLQSSIEPETPNSYLSTAGSERFDADLNSSYRKIDHLSELLNESEANNFRLIEQVRVLKEEVRRLERNKEREEHSENLEYLKNIFVKFSTLQTGDEKSRLIPVLTTMLKLSPLEQQQLRAAAGELPEPNSSSAGWGNYIPRWSGLM